MSFQVASFRFKRLTCGHLRSLKWPHLLRSLAVTCSHLRSLSVTCGHLRSLAVTCGHLRSLAVTRVAASLAVTCGYLRSLEWPCLLRSLAVTCGHSSGRVSCGLLRTLAVTRVAGLLRPLAVSCGHSSGRVSCGCGHLRSLEWPVTFLAVTCGHSSGCKCGHEWLQVFRKSISARPACSMQSFIRFVASPWDCILYFVRVLSFFRGWNPNFIQ